MNTLLSTAGVLAATEMTPRLFDLDFQLLADSVLTIIAVFALFLVMSYFLFNPARAVLKKRQEKIQTQLDDAKSNEEKANALRKEYEARLKNINKEAEFILILQKRKRLCPVKIHLPSRPSNRTRKSLPENALESRNLKKRTTSSTEG